MGRILLIEDDESLALGIEYSLMEEGYQVLRGGTVEEGKCIFEDGIFDLVLLDINLPDGTGYEICKYIKSKSEVPVIFLTALDEEVNVVLGLDMGGDDYITKPFRVRELLSRIKAVIRRSKKAVVESKLFKSGDIEINTSTAEIMKKGEKINLTAQEYRLLLIFINNAKEVLSKEKLLNEIFEGEGAYVDENTLSVYVKRLREKLEDERSSPKYIITKRGLGYKWDMVVEK
ncbi:response regulator transcription factor [Clostridium gasigenes]|uniref:Stage 0 sporulation protein A homolog n=1 Tax=Clostridium gasigenes TaxID=94869 RepID=A0A1H0QKX3_9CLOT|nr:response regulator transcription factor [Clostridium gasigenes]MBB6624542.1 response regulator transcription factor [Clostridium gasigenes]MBU3089167.1 response regulator transcription factor [Clostridium gasigenes]MBU3104363.1 response regulator transcription factor [Clostridium gasigenes]MBU3108026.1 response regulator transcription factor [Clostridium gasigenes]MBU3133936.1 response regulator transcription factor [Clostridium gasigenes]